MYRNEDTGRLAYDPAQDHPVRLLQVNHLSREMQWCCETSIIFKAVFCDTVPHFTTLAKFVSSHVDEIDELFEQPQPGPEVRAAERQARKTPPEPAG
tara:strand:+ start:911 stop:1201 length:291 start_codon:yes stop_codon:yes gene_type:complete